MSAGSIASQSSDALRRKWIGLSPAVAAMAYPFLLQAFHAVVSPTDGLMSAVRIAGAAILLALAFAMPLSGLAFAHWQTRAPEPDLRARRLAYASIAAPPLFVFVGVAPGLVGIHLPDIAIWIAIWLAAGLAVWFGPGAVVAERPARSIAGWRIAHGVSAALIACFVLFHLTNHLFGLAGPATHAAIMKAGRTVYRAPFIEPVLVLLLFFQVASGVRLAWRWSSLRADAYRVFQIGSGAYLSAFILAHLNSALLSARTVHKIDTNWAWAAGMPGGLDSGCLEYPAVAALRAGRVFHSRPPGIGVAGGDARPWRAQDGRRPRLVCGVGGRCGDIGCDRQRFVRRADLTP